MEDLELTPQERAAILTWHLSRGEAVTSRLAAKMVGFRHVRSARKLLCSLARVLPIARSEKGVWSVSAYSRSLTPCSSKHLDEVLEGEGR